MKLAFPPYPCLIESSTRRQSHERKISRIFYQPFECEEKAFIEGTRNHLFTQVENFRVIEIELLDENKVFNRIESDNPYRLNIKKIYDKFDHIAEHYKLYT